VDIEFIRTFLEISEAGSFVKAADRLNVTQSTVSTRIKVLEDSLGRPLFVRGRAGAELTPAGSQFRYYAQMLLRLWQQSRQDVAMPSRYRAVLNAGGQFSLWDRLLLRWLPWMRSAVPDLMIQAEVGDSDVLMAHLSEGLIDIAVLYNPQTRPRLVVEKLLVEKLVLVTTDPQGRLVDGVPSEGYVFVDWGPDFKRAHAEAYPHFEPPPVSVNLGVLGLQYILENGGSGYFPMRVLRGPLAARRVFLVPEAPRFDRPAYMVYPSFERYEDWFELACDGLRRLAAQETEE